MRGGDVGTCVPKSWDDVVECTASLRDYKVTRSGSAAVVDVVKISHRGASENRTVSNEALDLHVTHTFATTRAYTARVLLADNLFSFTGESTEWRWDSGGPTVPGNGVQWAEWPDQIRVIEKVCHEPPPPTIILLLLLLLLLLVVLAFFVPAALVAPPPPSPTMGGCVSTADCGGKAKSDLIDKQIEEDSKKYKKECKILLLGSGESGKSTIVKQMKIIHQDGFSNAELAEYRPVVYKNVLDSAQAVVVYMRKIGLECVEYGNRVLAEKILDYKLDSAPGSSMSNPYFSPEIADAIHQVWKDPFVSKVMEEHSSNFYLMDTAGHEVLRIGTPGYLPNETDVLRARQKSLGITETRFTVGNLSIHMFDVGGQRSERNKWILCFEGATSIIFCISLSEYDQVLLEEKTQSRMAESLVLFASVINSGWFLRTSIILFLNKIDVFKNKLPRVPLERYFPEYVGGTDINKAAKYILRMFMQANPARLNVYPHLTQATDTTNIRVIFAVVEEMILQNSLKDSWIL
ncbi:hypothetical protein D9615_010198 [Tricholomella constricta]|uniref:Guanine nucleotide-binding protein subunit alpha n=1 Tax=Tricholomella constricta TaxID=117010 RepID=A0A8H5GNN3_9AGAR|nr:hypothetical protein D9615_010198 [Tricholomella constricta]